MGFFFFFNVFLALQGCHTFPGKRVGECVAGIINVYMPTCVRACVRVWVGGGGGEVRGCVQVNDILS